MADNKDTSAATHFGRQMKKERLARGWSLHHLSERTAYDPAHLSRIENGLRPPARALAVACDAAFPERHGWFTEYYDESRQWAEVPPGFRDWSELEDKATQLRAWSPGIIHGLLQTEDYAHALLATMPGAAEETITGRLRARMERQRRVILRDIPPAAWFVVDELALCRLVGSAGIMTTQLRQLAALAAMPDITVRTVMRLFDSLRAECYRASESAALIERVCGVWASGVNPLTAGPTEGTA